MRRSSFQVKQARFHERGIFDTAWGYEVIAAYEDGLEIRMVEGDKGIRWVGTEGWIDLADEGQITAQPASILEGHRSSTSIGACVAQHHRNWLDCVKTRGRPAADAEVAHRSTTLSHAANIAMRLGRDSALGPPRGTLCQRRRRQQHARPRHAGAVDIIRRTTWRKPNERQTSVN